MPALMPDVTTVFCPAANSCVSVCARLGLSRRRCKKVWKFESYRMRSESDSIPLSCCSVRPSGRTTRPGSGTFWTCVLLGETGKDRLVTVLSWPGTGFVAAKISGIRTPPIK